MKKLRAREIYKCAGEVIVAEEESSKVEKASVELILGFQEEEEAKLNANDFELHVMTIEYSKGENGPLDFVNFYKHKADTGKSKG